MTCEICGREKGNPVTRGVCSHGFSPGWIDGQCYRLGYEREKAQGQIAEEGFAAARLTIARLVGEKIALETELANAAKVIVEQNHAWSERTEKAETAIAGARREAEELRKSLEPFTRPEPYSLADLRRARAALAAPADGEEKSNG